MDVATPTNDCLKLVYELLLPVIMTKATLSHQENRILGEIEDQIEQISTLVFNNYKSLDESSPSGIMDVFQPPTGVVPPVLEPAVKLYKLRRLIQVRLEVFLVNQRSLPHIARQGLVTH